MRLDGIAHELVNRGLRVTAIERTGLGRVIVGFDLLPPGRVPSWRKAIEAADTPDQVEHALAQWRGGVMGSILCGNPSPIVRQMIAEHGLQVVYQALGATQAVV